MNNGAPYCGNRRLKSFEVSGRSHPVHRFAVRTSKPPQQDPLFKTVEEGKYKTVEPESRTTTLRTRIRPGPRKFSPLPKNIIEGHAYSQYHAIAVLTGLSGPVHASGGRSIKPPPALYHTSGQDPIPRPATVKIPLRCPVYSEKSSPLLTIQFETLHWCPSRSIMASKDWPCPKPIKTAAAESR